MRQNPAETVALSAPSQDDPRRKFLLGKDNAFSDPGTRPNAEHRWVVLMPGGQRLAASDSASLLREAWPLSVCSTFRPP